MSGHDRPPPDRSPTRPRGRARRGEGDRLRDDILDAAQALLAETASEDAVSIRAVARAVGVTAPSIYRHFADKDMLLLEVCRQSFTRFTAALEGATTDDDPVARIAALARAYLSYAVENPEHYRIMFMARFELSAQAYAEEMVSAESSFGLLLRTARALIDAGRVRPDVAAAGELHLGILLWAPVHGLASLLVAKPGLPWPDRERLVDDLIAGTLDGLLLPPP